MSPYCVLITGCSSGFGLLTSARLAAAGHTVYATMRDLSKQDELLKAVASRGGQVKVLPLDVTDSATIAQAVATITQQDGKLDVLVNNAGYGLGGALEELLESELREQMETNFFGAVKVTQSCLPLLRKGTAAKIINISSIAGRLGIPGIGAYSASKFALEGYSEALWYELSRFGISVSLVEPGTFQTEVQKKRKLSQNLDNPDSHYRKYSQQLLEATDRRVTRRNGDPEEVAKLIEAIINTPNPKLRYSVGLDAKVGLFLSRLPFHWYRRPLEKSLLR
jgi:NAD(P)-dependent dehydrogenase (short-subunit alcohol dehydrogenase family)